MALSARRSALQRGLGAIARWSGYSNAPEDFSAVCAYLARETAHFTQKCIHGYCSQRLGRLFDVRYENADFIAQYERCRYETYAVSLIGALLLVRADFISRAPELEYRSVELWERDYIKILHLQGVPDYRSGWDDLRPQFAQRYAQVTAESELKAFTIAEPAIAVLHQELPVDSRYVNHDFEIVSNAMRLAFTKFKIDSRYKLKRFGNTLAAATHPELCLQEGTRTDARATTVAKVKD